MTTFIGLEWPAPRTAPVPFVARDADSWLAETPAEPPHEWSVQSGTHRLVVRDGAIVGLAELWLWAALS